jgi:hypothetical protein
MTEAEYSRQGLYDTYFGYDQIYPREMTSNSPCTNSGRES